MVWSPFETHFEIVEYDREFWEEMEKLISRFYLSCLLPEIVDPRAPRGMPIREPYSVIQVHINPFFLLFLYFYFQAQNIQNLQI